jgi:hypothetical protein
LRLCLFWNHGGGEGRSWILSLRTEKKGNEVLGGLPSLPFPLPPVIFSSKLRMTGLLPSVLFYHCFLLRFYSVVKIFVIGFLLGDKMFTAKSRVSLIYVYILSRSAVHNFFP